jgi:hypothetical protein
MNYTVKNVKTGPSREFGPNGSYTCNLYKGGKKIAEVFEAGDGGCLRVHWVGPRNVKSTVGFERMVTQDQLDFAEFCKTQTYVCEYTGETREYDSDLYIGKLTDDYLTTKQIRGWCRTKIVVRIKGDGEGEYRTFKCKYNPKVHKAQLESRFGDELVEIVNERFVV